MFEVGDIIQFTGRDGTACEVLAVKGNTLWVQRGSEMPRTVTSSDGWAKVSKPIPLPEAWCVVTATAVSKGFASRAVVLANLPDDAIAVLHVRPNGTVDVLTADDIKGE